MCELILCFEAEFFLGVGGTLSGTLFLCESLAKLPHFAIVLGNTGKSCLLLGVKRQWPWGP